MCQDIPTQNKSESKKETFSPYLEDFEWRKPKVNVTNRMAGCKLIVKVFVGFKLVLIKWGGVKTGHKVFG